jgi:hypothetical protein
MSEEEIKPPSRKAGPINIPSGSEIVSLLKPSPSIAVIKFAQGIIELIGRGVCLVVIFLAFLSSAIAIEQIQGLTNSRINFGATQAAAGWTIFLWLMSSIYEIFIVASRFLNFGFMMEYRKIYLIVDVVVSFVFAVGFFIALISLGAGAGYAGSFINTGTGFDALLSGLSGSLGAAAFFSSLTVVSFIFLGVWIILNVVLNWDVRANRYKVREISSEAANDAPYDNLVEDNDDTEIYND